MAQEQSVATSLLEVRILHDADVEAVRNLFAEVFQKEISAELWHWKYRIQDGCAVGVFKNGALVGHYGGVGATICYKGESARAVQIVDVMVKPSSRQGVRKQSPFFLASTMFLEHFIGYGKPYLLGYGFPSNRAMGLAERLGIYAPIGSMFEISWPIEAHEKRPSILHTYVGISSGNIDTHTQALTELWGKFRLEMQDYIFVQKDPGYIEHRYLSNPANDYTVLLMKMRLTGKPLGLIVLKKEPERVLLMDFIGPFASLPSMLELARRQAMEWGERTLATWSSATFVERFADKAAIATPLPITTPANVWTAGPAPEELHNRWWLMPGDTDFL